jgi:N-formylglutamate amidohydrolase
LFTCPHSGEKTLDKVRDSYPPTCEGSFTIENDALTSELTESICKSIEKISGKVPYSVIAEVHRMYVDYNRTQECAFEESSIIARDAYLEYHDRILQKIEEMLPYNSNDIAFLFDIHGTERLKVNGDFIEVIIGTDEGRSIQALTDVDPNAFWGTKGLIPLLQGKDIRAYPANSTQQTQGHILDGGHTIQTYGSKRIKRGLVAIQIEVIRSIRNGMYCRNKFGADMAHCIFNFVNLFVSAPIP